MSSSRILVIGGRGSLGSAIAAAAGKRALVTTRAPHVPDTLVFDARYDSPIELINRSAGALGAIVLAFGISGIDACARDPAGTRYLNIDRVAAVAAAASERGVLPVLLSTDYVFDGSREFWSEQDEPNPISEYGRQRLATERAIASFDRPHLILRIGRAIADHARRRDWLYRWCEAMQAGRTIRLATDQFLSPIAADDVGQIVVSLIDANARGLVHVAGPERLTPPDLFAYLHRACTELGVKVTPLIELHRLTEMPELDQRPASTALSIARLQRLLAPRFTPLSESARAVSAAFFLAPGRGPAIDNAI